MLYSSVRVKTRDVIRFPVTKLFVIVLACYLIYSVCGGATNSMKQLSLMFLNPNHFLANEKEVPTYLTYRLFGFTLSLRFVYIF